MISAMVDWVGLGETKFSRVVQVLIKTDWGEAGAVYSPDGRGGDKGIDVLAIDSTKGKHIYQIKYFDDGFSGDRKTSRKKQIRRSYETALRNHENITEWVLVVPKNLTPGEREFVETLSQEETPIIKILDSDDLDNMISKHPALYMYISQDLLKTVIDKYHMETATLMQGADDLSKRLSNLGDLADSVNPHWGVDMARMGKNIEFSLRPKYPSAPDDDPVKVNFDLRFNPETDSDELASFKRSMHFGARGKVGLPSHVVTKAAMSSSHPFFNSEVINPNVVMEAHSRTEPCEAEFRFVDSSDSVVYSEEAVLEHAGSGNKGVSLAFRILGCIEIEFDYSLDKNHGEIETDDQGMVSIPGSHDGALKVGYDLSDLFPEEVLRCAQFLNSLQDDTLRCRVTIAGKSAFLFSSDHSTDKVLDIYSDTAYDLRVVQEETNQHFKMPNTFTARERVDLRVARLILEGYIVESPLAEILKVTIVPSDLDLNLLEETISKWRLINFPFKDFVFEIGGRSIGIEGVYATSNCAEVTDLESLRKAVEAAEEEPFLCTLRHGENRYFFVYKDDRFPEDLSEQKIAYWSLEGIEQPGVKIDLSTDFDCCSTIE